MQKFVISPTRHPERLARFRAVNAHVSDVQHYPGVDAADMSVEDMKRRALVSETCDFPSAVVAQALSHVALWGNVAQSGAAAMVFEDSAVLCANFDAESARLAATLPHDWDIVLWGSNCQGIFQHEVQPGFVINIASFPGQNESPIATAFGEQQVTSSLFRLVQTLAPCGYAISPAGADKMIKGCLPLKSVGLSLICAGGNYVMAESLDMIMNSYYADMASYVAFPPLCLLPEAMTMVGNN